MAFDGKQIRNATIVGAKIANLTITDAQLAANAITAEKITNGVVDATKLAAAAVIEAKIADGAVTAAKLGAAAVTTDKLDSTQGSEAVSTDVLRDLAVTTAKIADGAITIEKIAEDAIDGTKVADGSITLAKLAENSVDSSKIVDGSITGGDIANDTVGAANLLTAYETTLLYRDGTRAMSGSLDLGTGNRIINLANPEQAQDAATKAYVDSVASSLDLKASVRVASTENIVLGDATTEVDGITLEQDDRVLAKNQSTATQNGIWIVNTSGPWSRATDANTSAEVTTGLFTFVEEGNLNANTGWVLTTAGPITIGTTELTFTQFSGAGSYLAGLGLVLTGNVFAADFNNTDGVVATVGATTSAGVSNALARADHSHALADGAVTTGKLANGAITADKFDAAALDPLKDFVEDTYLALSGASPMAGALDMGANAIGNLADPTELQDAATKAYVDSQIATAGGGLEPGNKDMVAEVTAADGELACAVGIGSNAKGYVQVYVNGIKVNVKGDLTGDCYFSTDGAAAKPLNAIVAGDLLYWNGSIAGYELAASDRIDFDYIVEVEA